MGVEPAPADLDFQGAWFAMHVTFALAGVGGMALAGAAGTLYLLQFREIKSKRLGKLFQLQNPVAAWLRNRLFSLKIGERQGLKLFEKLLCHPLPELPTAGKDPST